MELKDLEQVEKEILQEEGLIKKIVYTAKEILELPEEEFAVESLPLLGQEGFIHKGRIHLLAGYPKAGKTELTFRFAIDTAHTQKVLYISEEDITIIGERLNTLKDKFVDEKAKEQLIIITPDFLTRREFYELVKECKPDVVIVDTLRSIFSGEIEDEKDATAMTAFFNEIRNFLRRDKITAIFNHHITKSSHPDNLLKDIAGSPALAGLVDTVLLLTNVGENRRKLYVFGRLIKEKSLTYKANEETREFEVVEEVESNAIDDLEEIVLGLEKEWDNKFLTTLEVQSLIKKVKGLDVSKNELLKVLNRLYEKNPDKLERYPKKPGKGKTYKWRLVSGEKENDFSELDIPY
jgi:predicted ATP-dependent serine protease